jgi:uncharacterized protein (DUF934 family)
LPKVIRDGRIVDDEWILLAKDDLIEFRPHTIVSLTNWVANRDKFAESTQVGIWLDSDEDPQLIADDVAALPLIALNFPIFTDGRAYSTASILRRVYAFEGELRAIGDVRRDQMEQMQRCGFNSFQLAQGQDPMAALAAFKLFSYNYQSSIDRPNPLFRNRNS